MNGLNRIDWIQKIHPNFKEEKWFYDNVIRPNEIEHFEFYEESSTYKDYINPNKIIGISYADAYNYDSDITWIELLNKLRRLDWVISNLKTYEDIINHIHYNKSEKYVSKYGDFYITTSGQHRLCLSKFLNLEKVEVNINEYKLNVDRLKFYSVLKDNIKLFAYLGFPFKTEKELMDYTKNNNYLYLSFEHSNLKIHSQILDFFIEYYKNLNPNFLSKKYAKLKKFLNPADGLIDINSVDKLKKYEYLFFNRTIKK